MGTRAGGGPRRKSWRCTLGWHNWWVRETEVTDDSRTIHLRRISTRCQRCPAVLQ